MKFHGGFFWGCGCSRCVPKRVRRTLTKRARRRENRSWRKEADA